MSNQSMFVKVVIWLMIFLMSVGFAALIITPFMGAGLFGAGDGRKATEKQLETARAKVRKHDCTNTPITDKQQLAACRAAFTQLAAAYQTLAYPSSTNDGTQPTEYPKDARRNLLRAGDAYRAAYELDEKNADAAKQYGAYLRDSGKYDKSITIWQALIKRHPNTEEYVLQLAASQQAAKQLDQAIETYNGFIKKFKDSGQLGAIKKEIESLREQKAEQDKQAAGGGLSGAGGSLPITVG